MNAAHYSEPLSISVRQEEDLRLTVPKAGIWHPLGSLMDAGLLNI